MGCHAERTPWTAAWRNGLGGPRPADMHNASNQLESRGLAAPSTKYVHYTARLPAGSRNVVWCTSSQARQARIPPPRDPRVPGLGPASLGRAGDLSRPTISPRRQPVPSADQARAGNLSRPPISPRRRPVRTADQPAQAPVGTEWTRPRDAASCSRTSALGTAKPPSPVGEPVIAANTVATT